jgi:hypothetical protein
MHARPPARGGGDLGARPARGAFPLLLRACAALAAATAALSGTALVASAAAPPPDTPGAQRVAVVRAAEHGRSALHRALPHGAAASLGASASLGRGPINGILHAAAHAVFSRLADLGGQPEPTGAPSPGSSGGATGGVQAVTTPLTGTLRTAVTPLPRRRSPTALPATGPSSGRITPRLPDVVVVPPAALPTPPVIRPAPSGFAVAPLVVLCVGVVTLGGLLGLRIYRRST